MDGQYVIQDAGKHAELKLPKTVFMSWDLMHRTGLIKKHADTPKTVKDVFDLIIGAMKNFSSGKSSKVLLKCSEQFPGFFYRPKFSKTMKFSSHSEIVFLYILDRLSDINFCL